MQFFRACLIVLIIIAVPLSFFIAFWIGQGSVHISKWSNFAQGMWYGITIVGLPFGAFIANELFRLHKPKKKHPRTYSA